MKNKNKLGQYFTTNIFLKNTVFNLILNNPKIILEPSIGQGDLVNFVLSKNKNINFDLYEIDQSIKLLDNIKNKNVIYTDFLQENIKKKYQTIIGNPPFIKTKNGNLYIDFVHKCFNLLEDNGELIFIVPTDFLKLTSSNKIINEMIYNGTFTHIIHPNKENFFENASIDIIVFRYCKNFNLEKVVLYNDTKKYINNTNGILTFSNSKLNLEKLLPLVNYFDIYVGMVSGKEEVFKNEQFGNINIISNENKIDKYILIDTFPTKNNDLNHYMIKHKNSLLERKIRKFNENNWYEWGALRNYKNIINNINKDCIYINNLTRKEKVAFQGKVNFFGGQLLILIPLSHEKKINLKLFENYLNSEKFKENYMYSGKFKIGHKQLCNSLIDISHFV